MEKALKAETGSFFVLNLDDTNVKYEEMSDPDLKEFYGADAFLPQLWSTSDIGRKDLWDSVGLIETN